jgi:acetyl-CoA acetyltransferase
VTRVSRAGHHRRASSRASVAAFTPDGSRSRPQRGPAINDGALPALVGGDGQEGRKSWHCKPLARHPAPYCTTGVVPKIMGMGPLSAMRKGRRPSWAASWPNSLILIVLNEAFAAQSRSLSSRELGPRQHGGVNVHGRAPSRSGIPIGPRERPPANACSTTLECTRLQARGGGRGAASLCYRRRLMGTASDDRRGPDLAILFRAKPNERSE